MNGVFESDRLERVISNAPKDEIPFIFSSIERIYGFCEIDGRISILGFVRNNGAVHKIDFNEFLHKVYKDGQKDLIYYGIIAERVNSHFTAIRR